MLASHSLSPALENLVPPPREQATEINRVRHDGPPQILALCARSRLSSQASNGRRSHPIESTATSLPSKELGVTRFPSKRHAGETRVQLADIGHRQGPHRIALVTQELNRQRKCLACQNSVIQPQRVGCTPFALRHNQLAIAV